VPSNTRGTPAGPVAYIALGSNLGDRERHLADARAQIAMIPGVSDVRWSAVEETAPIGPVEQGSYLNQMVALRTTLDPHALLQALQSIEHTGGRERDVRWGPRTIDLDIVVIEGVQCHDSDLVLPHPEITNRNFWQRELTELGAPGFSAGIESPSLINSSL
jgi:2-amino-4-hydroxy-6-hydroxymethyldihydropteridine diphosphokinase